MPRVVVALHNYCDDDVRDNENAEGDERKEEKRAQQPVGSLQFVKIELAQH